MDTDLSDQCGRWRRFLRNLFLEDSRRTSVLKIYTALLKKASETAGAINPQLVELLERDDFDSVEDAVGEKFE